MQPLRVILPGEYWDSQIYMGRLYAWTRAGGIAVYNWDRVVDSLEVEPYAALAIRCAFARSDLLYAPQSRPIVGDPDVALLLRDKFAEAGKRDYVVDGERMRAGAPRTQDSPTPFPHADATIYMKKLFVACRSGLFSLSVAGNTAWPVSTRRVTMWDGHATGVSASWGTVAIAGGSDGLFEVPQGGGVDARNVHAAHASGCEWNYCSIYASSHVNGGYLADYGAGASGARLDFDDETSLVDEPRDDAAPAAQRHFRRVLDGGRIFAGRAKYTWGAKDKICGAAASSLWVSRYRPGRNGDPHFSEAISLPEPEMPDVSRLVSARTASFGVVLEFDDHLRVVDSGGVDHKLSGAPVNWRVFPRSRRYESHLHVIRDSHLEILSFNHDYFVDQKSKLLGTQQGPTRWAASTSKA